MAQHISVEKESDKLSPQHTTRPAITGRTSRPLSTLQDIANRSTAVQRVSALQDMANARYALTQLISEEEADVRQDKTAQDSAPVQRRESSHPPNGLPQDLKSGIENLSGISMADVTVQRNSSEPAKVGAHAFAQGTNIHLGPGQDKHLPHEAWHVVQQKQGRVKPTVQMKGVAINDDAGLEREADIMGAKAMQLLINPSVAGTVVQLNRDNIELREGAKKHYDDCRDDGGNDLPHTDEDLENYVKDSLDEFTVYEKVGNGELRCLYLGEYRTKNGYEIRQRPWFILIRETQDGKTIVFHYGPCNDPRK